MGALIEALTRQPLLDFGGLVAALQPATQQTVDFKRHWGEAQSFSEFQTVRCLLFFVCLLFVIVFVCFFVRVCFLTFNYFPFFNEWRSLDVITLWVSIFYGPWNLCRSGVPMSVQVTPLLSIVGFQFDVGWTTLYPLQSRECLYKVAWPGYTRVKNSIDVCWTFLYLPHPTPEQRTPLYSSLPGWHPLKNQNRCCWRFRCRYLFGYRFRLVSDFF